MTNGITRIAVAGVGNVGTHVLDAILATSGLAKPVILTRNPDNETVSKYASKATVVKIPSYDDTAAVTKALQDNQIEALVATTGGGNGDAQLPIATAAKDASVKVFVSAEFGLDFRHLTLDQLHPFIQGRKSFQDTLNKLGVPWISLATGLFAEWVPTPTYGFELKDQKVTIYGDGKQKFAATSLPDIGRATVLAVLAPLPSAGAGRNYAIQGIEASWNDWVAAAEKTSGKKIEVTHKDLSELERAQQQPDIAGFIAYLRVASADGRLITPDDSVDNKAIGFAPEVTIDDIIKLHL